MPDYETAGLESRDGDRTDLEQRDVRALTRKATVVPLGGDIFSVTTDSGSEYQVDAREVRCTCPDYQHREPEGGCYHVRRVAFARGDRPIPAWVDHSAVDPQLGLHVDSEPVVGGAVADGGQVVEVDGEDTEEYDVGCADCVRRESDEELCAPCFDCFSDGVEFPTEGER